MGTILRLCVLKGLNDFPLQACQIFERVENMCKSGPEGTAAQQAGTTSDCPLREERIAMINKPLLPL